MVKYIKSSSDRYYIGGDLYDIDWESEDLDKILEARAEEIEEFIIHCADYYVAYWPKNRHRQYYIVKNTDVDDDVIEAMAIKDGINVMYTNKHLEITAYDSGYEETVYLYPVLTHNAEKALELIDDTDFSQEEQIDKFIKKFFNLG